MRLTSEQIEFFSSLNKKPSLTATIDEFSQFFGFSSNQKSTLTTFCNQIDSGVRPTEGLLDITESPQDKTILRARFLSPPQGEEKEGLLGKEFDFFANGVPFTLATALCHLANVFVPKNYTSAIVTSIRNEGPWILEWIAFYKALNVNRIIIFYNDNDDESDDLLRCLCASGVIDLFKNEVSSDVSPQRKAFNFSSHLLPAIHRHRWVAYFDADEFLWPLVPGVLTLEDNIQNILKESKIKSSLEPEDIAAVLVHWKWFPSDKYDWQDGYVIDRFQESRTNSHVKTIVRPETVWSMERLHYPYFCIPTKSIDSSGRLISNLSEEVQPATYDGFQLNHYFAKSFQEFSLKKARGRGATGLNAAPRDYQNFNWGRDNKATVETLPNIDIRERMATLISQYLTSPQLLEAVNRTNAKTRKKLAQLISEVDLLKIYKEVINR